MDALFGHEQFKSDVTWKRTAMREGAKRWVWTHDTLLFYAGPRRVCLEPGAAGAPARILETVLFLR